MSDLPGDPEGIHASSQGHTLAGAEWLDLHFEAARTEYEAMLRSVGIQPGWHVLDAGCGGGSFLPLIAHAVGPTGQVTALDLAPENIAAVEARLGGAALACPITAQVGSLLALPFPGDHFDAVWCANVVQYLADDELATALREFRRVVRPGGLVAVKEVDLTIENFTPGDPGLLWRLLIAVRERDTQIQGMLRTPALRRWLERADLEAVWQRRTLEERWAPLRPVERTLCSEFIAWYAGLADSAALPEEDHRRWRALLDLEAPDHPLNSPDFHTYGAYAVAVGRVPLPENAPASN
jgi:ubiquinone/menaquinone biosynthesis C-methylase UbiE